MMEGSSGGTRSGWPRVVAIGVGVLTHCPRSAEGVQLGHVCSAAGVAGIWTGASHDRGKALNVMCVLYIR